MHTIRTGVLSALLGSPLPVAAQQVAANHFRLEIPR